MRKIEEKMQRMNALATQIIDISVQSAQPTNGNLKYRVSIQRQQRYTKNALISELMTLIAECRRMSLNQTDKASLDASITRLNSKLYQATSLTIL